MGRTIEQQLSELYLADPEVVGRGLPEAVNAARRGFLETLTLAGLPTTRDERYRHTDLRSMFTGDWEVRFEAEDGECEPLFAMDAHRITVVGGFCTGGLTELPSGMIYGSLREAFSRWPELVAKHYNSVADNENDAVTALASLFMQDGAFVYVPEGVKAEKPLLIEFRYDAGSGSLLSFPRALIVAERGASADIVTLHHSSGRVLSDYVREVVVGEGARLGIGEISIFGEGGSLIAGHYLAQQGSSETEMMNLWLRADAVRVNAVTDLRGRDADSNLKSLYFGTGGQRTDINITVNHLVPDCRSSELVKGIVSGEAVGAFTGKVYVAKDAQRTAAMQQSRNLQMSAAARIYTEPQLEIYADDVKCSHGATVGQMDDDMIMYMRQRGISEEDAKRLRLSGFVNDVLSECRHPEICAFIELNAEKRINEL